jgi:hypothetical protein
MIVQAVLLRVPATYTGETVGLTKTDPVTWILAGVPIGSVPAVFVAFLLHAALRLCGRVPSLDARERMLLPVAGTCLVVAAAMIHSARAADVVPLGLVAVFATATLLQTALRDRARTRWLGAAFAGGGAHVVVPIEEVGHAADLPAFASGAPSEAAIVRLHGETGYRAVARTGVATTAVALETATRPLRRRRAFVIALFVLAALAFAIGDLV